MRTLILVSLLVSATPMLAQEKFPPLADLLPKRETHPVEVMEVRYPPRAQELGEKNARALAQNRAWAVEWMKQPRPPGMPPPWHPNTGLTEAEYQEMLALGRKGNLVKAAEATVQVVRREGSTTLRFQTGKDFIQPISFQADGSVVTPLAKLPPAAPRASASTGGMLGPHVSYRWQWREGGESLENYTSIDLSVGRITATGRSFLRYLVMKQKDGRPEIAFETTLLYDPT